jgi:hypothetical protein
MRGASSLFDRVSVKVAEALNDRHNGLIVKAESRRLGVGAMAAMMCFWSAPMAFAQDLPVETPQDLLQAIEPTGGHIGNIEVFPQISGQVGYDSNIYNRSLNVLDDGVAVLSPAISFRSDLSRHAVRLDINAELRRYLNITEEDSEQVSGTLAGRLDLSNNVTVAPTFILAQKIERRGSFGDSFLTDSPVQYFQKFAGIEVARQGARLELRASASFDKKDYEDNTLQGVPIKLDNRDVGQFRMGASGYYSVSPRLRAVVTFAANKLDYDLEPVVPRGSRGWSLLGGVQVQITNVITGEVQIGYQHQSYDDPNLPDYSGLDYYFEGRWTPTPRLQMTALGSRTVERSPNIANDTVIHSRAGVATQYALGNKLMAGLDLSYVHDNYNTTDRKDHHYGVDASLEYIINPHFSSFVKGGYRRQTSKGLGAREYDGADINVGLKWVL